jgi:hypothetical protein
MKTVEQRMFGAMILLALLSLCHAGNTVAETRAPDGTDDAQKITSSMLRDPFWPVGYLPETVKSVVEANKQQKVQQQKLARDWNRAMKKIAISGVSKSGTQFYAVINNEIKSVGDTISIEDGGSLYTWAVESIVPPSTVKLRRLGAH